MYMRTMEPNQLSAAAKQVFKLIEFDADEKLLYELRKHWFGLFVIYATGSFIIALLLGIAFAAAAASPEQADLGTGLGLNSLALPVVAITLLLAFLAAIFTSIAAYLYKSNVIIVTSEKLAQLLNPTLFHRKISQLSIGDVQDATVVQKGLFPHMFHYGTIVIETAGEQQNYNFTYAPHPYEASKAIVNAHEENLKLYGN
jgi:hypothetical protein